jgi:beta-glucosidase
MTQHIGIEALVAQMTLAEKAGQMAQAEKNSITPAEVRDYALGSVLSGGGGNPTPNTPGDWRSMTNTFNEAALESRLKIPLIYGADCVHGHNNVQGATIFPHQIGLGASRDPLLVERVGAATGREMLATGVHWNFGPCLAVPQDYRWGRTYEGFGGEPGLVGQLGAAYIRGQQAEGAAACMKHFAGDGGAEYGKRPHLSWAQFWEQNGGLWSIDHGDVNVDEATFRALHLAPYFDALRAGALTVMASFNSWRGLKMHAHRYLLTDVLKNEMGFSGFIVSDWMGISQLSPDYYTCVVQSINAGLDMVMVPYDFKGFINALVRAVEQGDVPISRVDDAVQRILSVKLRLGLFDQPNPGAHLRDSVGSSDHRALAREAVRKSAVLLKNEDAALPLRQDVPCIRLAGVAADDIGLQCGGWTIEWQGRAGNITTGTTLRVALRQALPESVTLDYQPDAAFDDHKAPVGVVVVSETPYAEGCGDSNDLTLPAADLDLIRKTRAACEKLVLVIYSGRPLVITEAAPLCDAIVAAWLPGSEGDGLADVLLGKFAFEGKLPQDWIASMDQLPAAARVRSGNVPLYAYGYGL